MKTIFTLCLFLFSGITAFASYNEGWLTVSSVSKAPLRIIVDGRSFTDNNSGNEVSLRDLRPGYHTVKVIQFNRGRSGYGWNGNGRMKTLYESTIFIKPNFHVDILINRFGKVLIDERQLTRNNNGQYDDDDWDYDNQHGYGYTEMDSRSFDQLKQTLRNESFDNTRLSIAKQAAASQYFKAVQVKELMELFSFEKNRLELAKFCYSRTIDKGNYFIVNDAFSFSNSKEELSRYMRETR